MNEIEKIEIGGVELARVDSLSLTTLNSPRNGSSPVSGEIECGDRTGFNWIDAWRTDQTFEIKCTASGGKVTTIRDVEISSIEDTDDGDGLRRVIAFFGVVDSNPTPEQLRALHLACAKRRDYQTVHLIRRAMNGDRDALAQVAAVLEQIEAVAEQVKAATRDFVDQPNTAEIREQLDRRVADSLAPARVALSEMLDQGQRRDLQLFRVWVWCRDCLGEDPAGCFDGKRERVGDYRTREAAAIAGEKAAEQNCLWDYEIQPPPG